MAKRERSPSSLKSRHYALVIEENQHLREENVRLREKFLDLRGNFLRTECYLHEQTIDLHALLADLLSDNARLTKEIDDARKTGEKPEN